MRLTPLYAVVIFFSAWLLQYAGSGPLWALSQGGADIGNQCATYWFANLLYVNNLARYDNTCLGHSWYLANDFQLFVAGVVVIVVYM
eukprot:gene50237-52643_t